MNQHLTWDQISDYLIGDAAPQYAQHARECPSCRSEVARFESALTEFRGAVRQWTGRMCRPEFKTSVVMHAGAGDHLDRLLMPESLVETPWYQRIGGGIGSVAVHAAMLALLLFLGSLKPVQKAMKDVATLIYQPPPVKLAENKGGGGGGARQPIVKQAELPKPVRQFVAPTEHYQTQLAAPVSVNADLPDIDPTAIGAQTGLNAFAGTGAGGGFGSGGSGGIGGGKANGVGLGIGGGTGGGAFRPGNGVSNPVPILHPEPQYSEEARKAKWQGAVMLSLVVDENGKPTQIRVIRPLGLGLDEKAVEAVSKWTFKPGMKDGKPVAVQAQIEVTFRLL
jgi:periplasmic protein TonB